MKLAFAVGVPLGILVGALLWAQVDATVGAFGGVSTAILSGIWANIIFERT